ncbi:MAG: MarC family protein [Atribacterota bacterium]
MNVDFFTNVFKSFIVLIIILDPFLSLAVFISLTRDMNHKERGSQAFIAVLVAFVLLLLFLFLGQVLFQIVGITFSSFTVAGGVILLILGIQEILGLQFSQKEGSTKVAAVIIGTPLLCGPGAITSIILLYQKYGFLVPIVALILSLFVAWLMLLYSEKISQFLGDRIVEVLSRVLGLILAAMAVEFIKEGIMRMITEMIKK